MRHAKAFPGNVVHAEGHGLGTFRSRMHDFDHALGHRPEIVSLPVELGLSRFVEACHLVLDLVRHRLGFFCAENLKDRRKKLLPVVADVLLEGAPQLGDLAEKLAAVLRHRVQFSKTRCGLLVVAYGGVQQILHPVLLQDRKQVLLLQIGKKFQLVSQIRQQTLARLGCTV